MIVVPVPGGLENLQSGPVRKILQALKSAVIEMHEPDIRDYLKILGNLFGYADDGDFW